MPAVLAGPVTFVRRVGDLFSESTSEFWKVTL